MFGSESNGEWFMNAKTLKGTVQPKPFTPGLNRAMVRQHAYVLFRGKLPRRALTLENWVLAEKDLVQEQELAEAEA